MNGSKVALDTNQAIAVLNDTGDAGKWVQTFSEVDLPVPVVGELRFGALNSQRVTENLEHDLPLATSDEHFLEVDGLKVIKR